MYIRGSHWTRVIPQSDEILSDSKLREKNFVDLELFFDSAATFSERKTV